MHETKSFFIVLACLQQMKTTGLKVFQWKGIAKCKTSVLSGYGATIFRLQNDDKLLTSTSIYINDAIFAISRHMHYQRTNEQTNEYPIDETKSNNSTPWAFNLDKTICHQSLGNRERGREWNRKKNTASILINKLLFHIRKIKTVTQNWTYERCVQSH